MAFSLSRAARVVPARVASSHVRNFNIHEYQGKILCDNYGVKVQKWRAAETPEAAKAGAVDLSSSQLRHHGALSCLTLVLTARCSGVRREGPGSCWWARQRHFHREWVQGRREDCEYVSPRTDKVVASCFDSMLLADQTKSQKQVPELALVLLVLALCTCICL